MSHSPLVGYYVHHQGRGHLHRALALGRELTRRGLRLTFLSSLSRPDDVAVAQGWLELPRDDDGTAVEPAPRGLLHWVPRQHDGLRNRMATVSSWIAAEEPVAVVSDVSQEMTLLCRLHGVPVVSVVLPGDRGDAAHQLGLGLSDRSVGFWPPQAIRMVSGLPPELAAALVPVGALSRFSPGRPAPERHHVGLARRLLVLSGMGGDGWRPEDLGALRTVAHGWDVEVLGEGAWSEDPWPRLQRADVVVTRAGQASVAEVAAARVPAVVVPARRPHDEQSHTASQLDGGRWPALVRPRLAAITTADLDAAGGLDGAGWGSWCDGGAAGRFADVVEDVVRADRLVPAR